jgi:hypothetical protein
LERHFAADRFEDDRPAWSDLESSKEEQLAIGPTDKELRVVWASTPSGKAAGADDITCEALDDACPAALNHFLRLVTACIHKKEFPPSVMLVIFVMIYKCKGDVNAWVNKLLPLFHHLVPPRQTLGEDKLSQVL